MWKLEKFDLYVIFVCIVQFTQKQIQNSSFSSADILQDLFLNIVQLQTPNCQIVKLSFWHCSIVIW